MPFMDGGTLPGSRSPSLALSFNSHPMQLDDAANQYAFFDPQHYTQQPQPQPQDRHSSEEPSMPDLLQQPWFASALGQLGSMTGTPPGLNVRIHGAAAGCQPWPSTSGYQHAAHSCPSSPRLSALLQRQAGQQPRAGGGGGGGGAASPRRGADGAESSRSAAAAAANSITRSSAKEAQKRFRVRQKDKMGALQQALKSKSVAAQNLTSENEELRIRARVLERVVLVRDIQIETLRKLEVSPAYAAQAASAGDAHGPFSGVAAQQTLSALDVTAPHTASASHALATRSSLENSFSVAASGGPGGALFTAFEFGAPGGPLVGADLAASMNTLALDESAVKLVETFTGEDARRMWVAFTHEASACLGLLGMGAGGGGAPSPSITARLNCCVRRVAPVLYDMMMMKPLVRDSLVGMDLESGHQTTDVLPESHWRDVLISLCLTAMQRQDTRAMYDLFRQHLAGVLKERQVILAQLQGIGTRPAYVRGSEREEASSFVFRGPQPAEILLVDLLDASMRKEKRLCTLVNTTFMRQLQPVQYARIAVHSYPRFPDVLAMVAQVAELPAEALATAGL